jgi:hypothetical protein
MLNMLSELMQEIWKNQQNTMMNQVGFQQPLGTNNNGSSPQKMIYSGNFNFGNQMNTMPIQGMPVNYNPQQLMRFNSMCN